MEDLECTESVSIIDNFEKKNIEGTIHFCCKELNCKSSFRDKSNAIRHLRTVHKSVFNFIVSNKKKNKQQLNDFGKSIELRVKVDPNEILKACVSLVTVNALPLSVLDYPSFKKILQPYLIALELRGINLIINRHVIKDEIEKSSNEIKKMIVAEMRNKPVCLMVDIASRYKRSILGVNVAYKKNEKIIVRTIGMQVLRCTHTANNIVNIIKKSLSDFGISLRQILSVTTDQGKNLLKATAQLDAEFHSENLSTDVFSDDDSDIEIDDDIFDEDYYSDLLNCVRSQFDEALHTDLIHGVTCAAHCLHLIVIQGIENCPETNTLVDKCRELATKLRTPTFKEMLTEHGKKCAVLDVKTRWNTIQLMVQII